MKGYLEGGERKQQNWNERACVCVCVCDGVKGERQVGSRLSVKQEENEEREEKEERG